MSEPEAAGAEPQTTPPARRSTYLRSGAVALVVVVVMGYLINLLLLQRHTGSTLDGHEVAQLVSQGIQAQSGSAEPPQVSCPPSIPIHQTNFNCTLEKGKSRVVVQVQRDPAGRLSFTVTDRAAS
jgi:Domain of unknown function (DUF4333)